jgi:DNA replication and repair protein RecF
MRLEWLDVRDFRNHQRSRLACGKGTTVLVGNNGEGKTNLVEAVSYICLTKSFYADNDGLVVRRGAAGFLLDAELWGDSGIRYRVRLQYDAALGEKKLTVNGAAVEKLSEQIGRFPIVVLSPEQSGITAGLPAERRRFMDLVISQSSRAYLEDLVDYRQVLRQRNKILLDAKLSHRDCAAELTPWNESLADVGSRIMQKRIEFLAEFRPSLTHAYNQLAGSQEEPAVEYVPSVAVAKKTAAADIRSLITEALQEKSADELRLAASLAGPHRDELKMELSGLEARKFASQGQHKTLLIALKLAELQFLKERSDETPILVLDDVLSELDRGRSERLLGLLPEFGQTFVTTTTDTAFPGRFYENENNRRVVVAGGTIAHEESTVIR